MQAHNIYRIKELRKNGSSLRSRSEPVPPTPCKRRKTRQFRPRTPEAYSSHYYVPKNQSTFDIDGVICVGDVNIIYKIHKASTKKCYALKATKNNFADHQLSEVSILQKLQTGDNGAFYHINICKFRMFYIYQRTLHQIYEYYPLGTLRTLIQTQRTKTNALQIIQILAQTANALKHIHSKNIIHLDLKPENIFVKKSDNNMYILKIGDFGISVDIDYCADRQLPLRLPSGDAVYISPEILYHMNSNFDVKQSEYLKNTDIFSLGIIMIELIQDIRLPSRGPLFENLRNIDKESNGYIDWRCLRNHDDENTSKMDDLALKTLKEIVLRMLYKNPMHRLSSTQLLDVVSNTFAAEKRNSWEQFMKLQTPDEIKLSGNKQLNARITYDADKFNKI